MQWITNLFGKKTQCTQCNQIFPQKNQCSKRAMIFCSDACATKYHLEHPLPMPSGDPKQLAADALVHLKDGCDALSVLHEAIGGADDMSTRVMEFEKGMIMAMPALYALNMEKDADTLVSYDFGTLHGMSTLAGGAIQYARIIHIISSPISQCKSVMKSLQSISEQSN